MLNKVFVSVFLGLLINFLAISAVVAHEMWFEPVKYKVKKGETIFAHEKVGQDFKGNLYSYLKSSYKKLEITVNDVTQPVKSRIGDVPAIHEQATQDGLTIISAITSVSDVSYKTWAQFESFIKSKGLDWVLEKHKERGLPDKGFTEAYQRFPKALVQVGEAQGNDKELGMRFEWVLETNPYTTPYRKNGVIKARLMWEGEPLKKAHVSVFNKVGDKLIKSDLYTNEKGVVSIPQADGGAFLINSVQMIEPSVTVKHETGAVWESLWASVTYQIDKN